MDRKFHPRLIIIDATNIMQEFKECIDVNQNKAEQRMNPMVLVPLVHGLHQNGFRLRIVMKKMPSEEEVDNRYIIRELARMNVLIFSHDVYCKSHDVFMLSMADEYGAVIISNDTFSTHEEFKNVIERNTIKYTKSSNCSFLSADIHETVLDYHYSLSFPENAEKFYCYDDDLDYEKVKVSYKVFRLLSVRSIKILDILLNYVYAQFCLLMGFSRPIGLNFLKDDEELPARFDDFKFRCL